MFFKFVFFVQHAVSLLRICLTKFHDALAAGIKHACTLHHSAKCFIEFFHGQSLAVENLLDGIASKAKWIDVFSDRGAFNPDQTRRILSAGIAKGLKPRLHANQLEQGEGIAIGVEFDAASVDHISHFTDADIGLLAGSNTVATFLPGAEFSTRSNYPDARRMLEAGVTVALASDCNPGSSFTNNISFIIALAVREMFFSPEQALWSATAGGAACGASLRGFGKPRLY